MEEIKKLSEKGWYLTIDGFKKIADPSTNKFKDVNEIISTILNMDFRDIAGGALPTKREETIAGHIVLQLQKSRNISAPKSNEESKVSPRFLQLELTDGQTTIQALELDTIPSLSLNLPPGTKIYLRADRLQLLQGFLILRASELQILGGRVESLVEKWELARTMQKYARSGHRVVGTMGPPPWIAFGKKIDLQVSDERNFKSLQAGLDGKESKENEDFKNMRNEAIAEATKAGAKKIFGGGGQQMTDHNIKKILEKGYSEEDAKQVLRATNNNLERALYNLKRRAGDKRDGDVGSYKSVSVNSYTASKTGSRNVNTRDVNIGKRVQATCKEETVAAKPLSNVSLFDFLTDKLSETTLNGSVKNTAALLSDSFVGSGIIGNKSETPKTQCEKSNLHLKFENNMSSSFAANRSTEKQQIKNGSNSVSGSRMGHNVDCLQAFNSNNTHSERTNKNERILSSQVKLNNQNQCGRKNRPIQDRQNINTKSIASFVENENKKLTNSPRKNRGGEERYDSNSKGKDRYNKNNHASRLNKTETSKVHIFDKNGEEHKGPPKASKGMTSFPPKQLYTQDNSQQMQNSISNSIQYDTSKIIGFQNKETNEIAMTLLNSQNVGAVNISEKKPQHPSSPRHFSVHEQFSNTFMPPVPPQMQTSPHVSSSYVTPMAGYAMPSPQTVPTIPSHFGMIPGDGWQWKCGDICAAKYWDDGRYYEAEVTAVSEKTCVVLFLGYGNHEEVLKSDCLPITDANHCPVNKYNSEEQQLLPIVPARSQQIQIGTIQRGGNSQRLRTERQMYVPPPKRDN